MAIYYDSLSLTEDHLLAQGGQSGNGSRSDRNGGAGTIYLKSHAATMADVILDNQGIATNRTTTIPGGEYVSVTVRENARFTVQSDLRTEVPLTLTDATLTVSGGLTIPGDLNLTRSTGRQRRSAGAGGCDLNGSYLEVAGALQIDGDLSLSESSVLTHSAATTGSEYRLEVRAQNVTIDGTSRIDVSGRGYLGSYQGGNNSYYARTLGNTTSGGSYQGAGGSYGGWGNASNWSGTINSPYGDLSDPNEVGSGGSTASSAYGGGNGGGLLRLTAGTLQVDGSINADGNGGYYGGGSGGGIRLDVGTLSGNGWITARGGSSSNTSQSGGAGGGGRMAIYYDSLSLTEDHLLAQGGQSGNGSRSDRNGGAGTIYLKGASQQYGNLIVDNQNLIVHSNSTPMFAVGRGGIVSSTSDSLTAAGVNWKPGALIGLHFQPDINGPLIYRIADNDATVLYIDPTDGDLTLSAFTGNQFAGVYNFDAITVKGKAQLVCPDQLRIAGDLTVDDAVLTAPDMQAFGIILQNGGLANQ